MIYFTTEIKVITGCQNLWLNITSTLLYHLRSEFEQVSKTFCLVQKNGGQNSQWFGIFLMVHHFSFQICINLPYCSLTGQRFTSEMYSPTMVFHVFQVAKFWWCNQGRLLLPYWGQISIILGLSFYFSRKCNSI